MPDLPVSAAWQDPRVWLVLSVLAFGACALVPVWVRDDELLKRLSWWLLVPVSLAIIACLYPAGIEIFRRWATSG